MIESHQELALPAEAAKALQEVIARNVALALDCLRDASIEEPVAAVCLYSDQPESLALPDMIVTPEGARSRRALDDWRSGWVPADDEETEVWVEVPLLDDRDFLAAEEVVVDALEGRVLDPGLWVLLRVARQLNRERLPLPSAEDALVHVLNHDPGDEFIQELRFVAPPGGSSVCGAAGSSDDRAAPGQRQGWRAGDTVRVDEQ